MADALDAVAVPPSMEGDFRFLGAYVLPAGAVPTPRQLERAIARRPRLVAPRLLLGVHRARSGDDAGALAALDAAAALAPSAPGVWILRVEPLLRLGREDDAVASAHAALDAHPEAMDGFVRLLYALEGMKAAEDRGAETRILMEAARRAGAARPKAGWPRAVYAALAGRSPLQLEPLAAATRLDPKRAWIWAFRGRALGDDEVQDASGRRRREAERALSRALALAPRAGWIACWRAEVWNKLGRPKRAQADLDRGLRDAPDYHLARAWRARVRAQAGDFAGALEDLDICWKNTGRVAFLERRASVRASLGDAAGALSDAAECARVSDSHALRYGPHAWVSDLRRLPHEAPRFLDASRWRWRAWSRAGRPREGPDLGDRGRVAPWRPSERDLVAAARAGGGWTELWRGRLLLDAGRADEARPLLDRAVAANGSFAAYLWRAESRRDARGAAADLDQAIRASPRSIVALVARGVARLRLGLGEAAFEDFCAAAAADPINAGLVGLLMRASGALPRRRGSVPAAEFELRLGHWPRVLRLASAKAGARARVVRGWALAAMGRADAASWEFSAAADGSPQETDGLLTRFLHELPALPAPGAARAYAALARAEGRLGRRDERLRHLVLARRLGGEGAVAHAGPGAPAPRSLSDITRAMAADPTGAAATEALAAPGRAPAWALAWRGALARARADFAAAARDLGAAARFPGAPSWAHGWLGELELARGAPARALKPLARALRAEPSWTAARTWRGRALCELGRCAQAEADLRAAVGQAPQEPWPALALGLCLERRGLPEASRWLDLGRTLASGGSDARPSRPAPRRGARRLPPRRGPRRLRRGG